MTSRAIPWGAKVPAIAWPRLVQVSQTTGLALGNLTTCMQFESGMNPQARNPGSTATGLIQFMEATAKRLGTTTSKLLLMSFQQQLEFVELYFKGFMTHGHTLSDWDLRDTYMSILWPAAIGKASTYVMFQNDLKRNNDAYDVNKGLDLDRDSRITKAEVCAKIMKTEQEGLKPGNVRMI